MDLDKIEDKQMRKLILDNIKDIRRTDRFLCKEKDNIMTYFEKKQSYIKLLQDSKRYARETLQVMSQNDEANKEVNLLEDLLKEMVSTDALEWELRKLKVLDKTRVLDTKMKVGGKSVWDRL